MIARTSASEAPISAIRACGSERATCCTHSAPARVLPKPRPAQISQIRRGIDVALGVVKDQIGMALQCLHPLLVMFAAHHRGQHLKHVHEYRRTALCILPDQMKHGIDQTGVIGIGNHQDHLAMAQRHPARQV